MAPLYQDPITKLAIRFDQLSLYERPETQGPWDWKFASETLDPYVRPGTPMPARAVVHKQERPRNLPPKKSSVADSDEEVKKQLLLLLQDPRKGGKIAQMVRQGSQGS